MTTTMQLRAATAEVGCCEKVWRSVIAASTLKPFPTLKELERSCSGELAEVLEYVVEQCLRYAITVCKYMQAYKQIHKGVIDAAALAEAEDSRKIVHNATIDALNALSRALKRSGGDNSWIEKLVDRTVYQKFALLLALEKMEQEEV